MHPDVAELLEAPLPGHRAAPPNHRALIAEDYEPGLSEAAMVARQTRRLAGLGQLPPPPLIDFTKVFISDEAFTFAFDPLPSIAFDPLPSIFSFAGRLAQGIYFTTTLGPKPFIETTVA